MTLFPPQKVRIPGTSEHAVRLCYSPHGRPWQPHRTCRYGRSAARDCVFPADSLSTLLHLAAPQEGHPTASVPGLPAPASGGVWPLWSMGGVCQGTSSSSSLPGPGWRWLCPVLEPQLLPCPPVSHCIPVTTACLPALFPEDCGGWLSTVGSP